MGRIELLQNEHILATVNGDCWETPMVLEQVPGVYTFTDQRIIFQGNGLIEKLRLKFEIPYEQVLVYRALSGCIFSNRNTHMDEKQKAIPTVGNEA